MSQLICLGGKRFGTSLWKSFKNEFQDIEQLVSEARYEVNEEIQLASEQAAHGFRRLMIMEMEEIKKFRIDQISEMQESETFRSHYALASQKNEVRQMQKSLKEQGISSNPYALAENRIDEFNAQRGPRSDC